MVIASLTHGLANQMFQYAAARALSLRNKQELKLDISFFDNPTNATHEVYSLNVFSGLDNSLLIEPKAVELLRSSYENNLMRRTINAIKKRLMLRPDYTYAFEKIFLQFDPSLLSRKGKIIYLTGFFQNEKYFNDALDIIKHDFTFRSDCINETNKLLCKQIRSEEAIAVHIRRGDYIGNRNVSSLEYYSKAIEFMFKTCKNPVFYFFSDDQNWVKENIKVNAAHHYIDCNQGKASYQDLYLMSNCQHNIIANSSFSWWGAWLNRNKHKIVISPTQWLPEKGITSSNIVPDNWIQM